MSKGTKYEKHDWDYDQIRENPSQTIILVDRKCERCGIKEFAVFDQNEFGEVSEDE